MLLQTPVPFQLLGHGIALPEAVARPDGTRLERVTNRDIYQLLYGPDYRATLAEQGWREDYPETALGVRERRWTHWIASPPNHEETTSADLCERAARAALSHAGISAEEVDLFLCPCTTPARPTSSTATWVGGRLGIRAPAFEMKAGCSSGVYALLVAAQFLAAGARTVLVAGAETLSKICPVFPQSAFTVGDGAAALVLRALPSSDPRGMRAGFFDSDGQYAPLVTTPGLYPPTHEAIDRGDYYLTGDPQRLREVVPALWPKAVRACLNATGMRAADIDLYVPHQVNRQVVLESAQALEIPPERVYLNLDRRANVGGTSVLLALVDALSEERAAPGMTVALNVVGGGLTWAGLLLRL